MSFIEIKIRVGIQCQVFELVGQALVTAFPVVKRQVSLNERHLCVAVDTADIRIQLNLAVNVQVFEALGEFLRYQSEQRFHLPFAGREIGVDGYAVTQRDIALKANSEVIDSQISPVESEMHRIEVHRQRTSKFHKQVIGIGVVLDGSTHVISFQSNEHVVPTLRQSR